MRVENALRRILSSDKSDYVKMCKLWSLAAKQIPGSNAQRMVADCWKQYHDKYLERG